MPTLRATYNPTTRVVDVAAAGTAVPGGAVAVGNFDHPDPVYPGSTVVYHGVRELLYKRSHANPANAARFPNNITDMDRIQISLRVPTALAIEAAGGDLAPAATRQSVVTVTPTGAVHAGLVYSSSNPAVATVNATGLITAVSAGTATIRVTAQGGKVASEVNVTVA